MEVDFGPRAAVGKDRVVAKLTEGKLTVVAMGAEVLHGMQSLTQTSQGLAKVLLSSLIIEGLNRGSRTGTVRKAWEKAEIDSKWEQTNWAKKRDQIERRKGLTDFDRFKVLRLKKQRRFEERKALAKVKASA